MSDTRMVSFPIPIGDFEIVQSSGQIVVNCNLDRIEPDTISWLFNKGLVLAIRNAYASEKTTEARQEEAQRKANEIAANIVNAGRGSTFDELESAMIRIYVLKKYGGTLPQGGQFRVWKEISELPEDNLDRLRGIASVTIETSI